MKYFIDDVEVTKEEFVREERSCGFRPKAMPATEPATGGFLYTDAHRSVVGRVEYG